MVIWITILIWFKLSFIKFFNFIKMLRMRCRWRILMWTATSIILIFPLLIGTPKRFGKQIYYFLGLKRCLGCIRSLKVLNDTPKSIYIWTVLFIFNDVVIILATIINCITQWSFEVNHFINCYNCCLRKWIHLHLSFFLSYPLKTLNHHLDIIHLFNAIQKLRLLIFITYLLFIENHTVWSYILQQLWWI